MSVIPMRKRPVTAKLECSACGAAGEGSCNCGVSYVAAGARAEAAVKANPEKSNRAIAEDIGVDKDTVRNARRSGGEDSPPDQQTVTGKDGKSYPAKAKGKAAPSVDQQVDKFERRIVDFSVAFYNDFVVFLAPEPKLGQDHEKRLRKALRDLAQTCTQLSSLKQPEPPMDDE